MAQRPASDKSGREKRKLFYGCVIFHCLRPAANPSLIDQVPGMSEESRHRMLEPEKPLSTDMVKLRVGSDFNRSILVHELVAVFLLFIFESSLVFVLKTPKMFM
jgi:hypothetical protein